MSLIFIGIIALVCSSCASLPIGQSDDAPTTQTNSTPVIEETTDPAWYPSFKAAAIVWGLTNVDASAYGGWLGECPGSDVDARSLYSYYLSGGIPTTMLLNAGATKAAAQAAIVNAAAGLSANDSLIIEYSSHGTLVPDDNGDEADGTGQDSAICMYDGLWIDDDFLAFLQTVVPPGVNVRIGSDCCHSEGNFRGFTRKIQQLVSFSRWGQLPHFELRSSASLDFAVTQMAASKKLSYAYGAASGGAFTMTRLANTTGFWRSWFDAAKAKMSINQAPAWVESGPVTDEIRNAPVFPRKAL